MPRDGATTFDDLVGQLEELRVTCEKCGRAPQAPGREHQRPVRDLMPGLAAVFRVPME